MNEAIRNNKWKNNKRNKEEAEVVVKTTIK